MLNRRLLQCSLAACLALAASVSTASAQSDRASLVKRLDSLAGSGVMENRAAGIVAAVVKGNDTLLLKGYGKADVEWNIPMPADAMFEIGSITKQFTAVAILQLRDEGKLSLDDEITKWLPDFDTRGNKVTIRRLLDHTSGIKGITEMPEFGLLVSNPRFSSTMRSAVACSCAAASSRWALAAASRSLVVAISIDLGADHSLEANTCALSTASAMFLSIPESGLTMPMRASSTLRGSRRTAMSPCARTSVAWMGSAAR